MSYRVTLNLSRPMDVYCAIAPCHGDYIPCIGNECPFYSIVKEIKKDSEKFCCEIAKEDLNKFCESFGVELKEN